MNKEGAKQRVVELVARFQSLSVEQRRHLNEEATKQGFILPLFRALGWDTDNVSEVAPEEKASRGRVDYAFKIRDVPRFYLEAKPLGSDLTNPDWVKQAISYAYHKGIPWVVLTNFNDLWVFTGDVAEKRFLTLKATDFEADFDRLWLLSRGAVEERDLEREAAKVGVLPPRIPIEKRLYEQLRDWRERLSSQIHQYRPDLRLEDVDETVQRVLARLIFIRSCEDRRIEEPALTPVLRQWRDKSLRGSLAGAVQRIFRQFDSQYDSDLFNLHLADQVHVDDDLLADIIEGLYRVGGGLVEYDFSEIDADVLGRVYEQYLGYVTQVVRERAREVQLKLGRGYSEQQAWEEIVTVLQRPQRRKERGIYYTPKWVVDYIVKQTVGRFIEEHEKRPDAVHDVKILDMACGSGSFLIRAYDELLRWHAESSGREEEHIFPDERALILRNNIFGVDLDGQAVEIARLNLLLRSLAQPGLLPPLDRNVVRGNALISGGESELKPYFGEGWEEKRPFNWGSEFKQIMDSGGFDVVIGNPPWVESKRLPEDEKDYYEGNFVSMRKQYDLFNSFVERGIQMLKEGGLLGFIVPNRFVMNLDYRLFREWLLRNTRILEIRDVGEEIFEVERGKMVGMPALVLTVVKESLESRQRSNAVRIRLDRDGHEEGKWQEYTIRQDRFLQEKEYLFTIYQSPGADGVIARMESNSVVLKELVTNARGVEIGKKSQLVSLSGGGTSHVKFLVGEDIDRYAILGHRYLKLDDPDVDYKPPELYRGSKILIRKTGTGIRAVLDEGGFHVIQVIYIFKPKVEATNSKFILGLLNSKIVSFYYFAKFGEKEKQTFPHLRQGAILQLPIRRIESAEDRQMHDAIVSNVERMLELQGRLGPIRDVPTSERDDLLREIERVDREIDGLVYELYGLTEEERRLVEGG